MALFGNVNRAEKRRKNNIKTIKKLGIAYCENLPLLEDSSMLKLKDIDTICKRAIASLISIQIACDIHVEEDYEESVDMFLGLLHQYDAQDALIEKEKSLFTGTYTEQDVVDVMWTYESYWALAWALGLIKDIKVPYSICDCQKAISLVANCKSYKEFKRKCKLRSIEQILDVLDLYYQYHWAVTNKLINPSTPIGGLNPEVVYERRKGLEWLVSDEYDWNEIPMDT